MPSAPRNWKRLTVLGAVSCDGVMGVMTVQGGTSTTVFLDFLTTTLLPTLRDQKPDAVLVMDNLSANKSSAVKQAIEAAGLALKFLPRYSPEFSPIEPCWSKIKADLRSVAARTVEALTDAVTQAMDKVRPNRSRRGSVIAGINAQPDAMSRDQGRSRAQLTMPPPVHFA